MSQPSKSLLLVLALAIGGQTRSDADMPDRYWPAFPVPSRVLVSESHNGLPYPEGVLLQTLAGLVAYRARHHGAGEMVWMGTTANPSYEEWFRRWRTSRGVPVVPKTFTLWELVDRYREQGIVQGYVLYRREPGERPLYEGRPTETSANVATAMCSLLSGVAVEERLEEQARQHGLDLLADVRGRDEQWLWERFGHEFSRDVLGLQDPLSPIIRCSQVALRAMVVSGAGPLYGRTLAALRPGSPILGWGIGLEDEMTGPSSRDAALQTATNWCINLPLLSSGATGLDYPFARFRLPPAPSPVAEASESRYVSFVLSDGDNVQWLMLNFCLGQEARQYWACPDRGRVPFGWTLPAADLLQLCPYTLDYLRDTARLYDDFLLFGGGYYYPDWFGSARTEPDLLAQHARRIGRYMEHAGLSLLLVNVQDWDSPEALAAYQTYAREIPDLQGLFVVQYAPYTAGEGEIRWMARPGGDDLPVITARHAVWSGRGEHPREGTPGRVATLLNRWAEQPVNRPEDRFAWVIDHAWSWFRRPVDGLGPEAEEVEQRPHSEPDVGRGYRPALWCADRLTPQIQVVTPTDLVRHLQELHRLEAGGRDGR